MKGYAAMTIIIMVGSDEYKALLRRLSVLELQGAYIGLTARERTELFNIKRRLEAAELAHSQAQEAQRA